MPTIQTLELPAFPEELLEGILAHCVMATLSQQTRPSWHRPIVSSSTSHPIRGRLALLLVSKKFYRISSPLFYHTLRISSPGQLHHLLTDGLRPNPSLATYIRRVVFSGIWAEGGELLRLSNSSIRFLDITLDTTQLSPRLPGKVRDLDAEEFCEGLKELSSLTHIVIRKPNHVYLTQPKPRYVLSEIAKALPHWNELEFADLAFRLSDDSSTVVYNSALPQVPRVSPLQQGPITTLTQSLSTRPKLHTFSTLLPSIWNETILRVSTNPSLERIILGDGNFGDGRDNAHSRGNPWSGRDFYAAPVSASLPTGPYFESANQGILGTGIFLSQAKKHARLSELIRAGTSIMRTRAQTLGTPPMSPSPVLHHAQVLSSDPSPSTRAQSPIAAHPSPPYPRSQSVQPNASSSQSNCTSNPRHRYPQQEPRSKRGFQSPEGRTPKSDSRPASSSSLSARASSSYTRHSLDS